MSAPQIGGQFGSISNNNTGGGSGGSITPCKKTNRQKKFVEIRGTFFFDRRRDE